MHFTKKEYIEFLLDKFQNLDHEDAEKHADQVLRFVAKTRKVRDSKLFVHDNVVQKRDTNITNWKDKSIEDLKAISKSLSGL